MALLVGLAVEDGGWLVGWLVLYSGSTVRTKKGRHGVYVRARSSGNRMRLSDFRFLVWSVRGRWRWERTRAWEKGEETEGEDTIVLGERIETEKR